jgi:hypothetical protein
MPAGTSFVFLLPYDVFTGSEVRTPLEFVHSSRRIRLFPPFRNAAGVRTLRSLDNSLIPFPPGTRPPATQLNRIERLEGGPWINSARAADAIRLDMRGESSSDGELAEQILAEFLDLVRYLTRQWWIRRGPAESSQFEYTSFAIDSIGQAVGSQIQAKFGITSWFGSEIPLTEQAFRIVGEYMRLGATAPHAALILLDAVYAWMNRDQRSSALLAAIACENLFSVECYAMAERSRIPRSTIKRVVKLPSLPDRLDSGAAAVFGRSFKHELPDAHRGIEALWLGRHRVAHGVLRGTSLFGEETHGVSHEEAMNSALQFFTWISTVRSRDEDDTLRQLERPFR